MLIGNKLYAVAILLASQLVSGPAIAFDCEKASLPVDFVICSGWQVEQVNRIHESAWYAARARLNDGQKRELLDDQRRWLKTYPPQCGVPEKGGRPRAITPAMQDCVASALVERADFLNSYPHSRTSGSAAGKREGVILKSRVTNVNNGKG